MKGFLALVLVAFASAPAAAQSGPLTVSLKLEEPKTVAVRLGPLTISPSLSLPEIGYDSNVFDEETNPKTDWTLRMAPGLQLFARTGLIQMSVAAASEFTYYPRYESERSVSRQFRGRVAATLSRIGPWLSAAHVDLHDRPNREIDLRARHIDREVSAGVGVEVSSIATLYGMATRTESHYSTREIFKGVNLNQSLNRRGEQVGGGIKLKVTPFTTLLIDTTFAEDQFAADPTRNSQSSIASAVVELSPDAVLSGRATVGYQDFRPADRTVAPYRGVVASGSLTYTFLGRAKLNAVVERSVQYSFETDRAYYLDTGADLTYTQRIRGPYDVQGTASRRWLDYTRVTPGLQPTVDLAGVGAGYNLRDGSRIALNFEYSQRLDRVRPDRKYHRRRFFATYTVGQ